MKEQYIRQVEKELNLSRKAKTEVVRDLNEIFNSAVEHGETEQQVIERLGTPQEFANSTAEQFGIDNSVPKKRKWIISSVISLVVAIVAFLIYATAKSGKVPEGAIGQADAMTNIQVKYHHLNKKGIATVTVILRLNKHGLLPMIRVRAQCPTCLCL